MKSFLMNKKNITLVAFICCLLVVIVKSIKLYNHTDDRTTSQIAGTVIFGLLSIVNLVKYITFTNEKV
jgi:uncharacterized membrane protein